MHICSFWKEINTVKKKKRYASLDCAFVNKFYSTESVNILLIIYTVYGINACFYMLFCS